MANRLQRMVRRMRAKGASDKEIKQALTEKVAKK